jgi:hypothetical protein
MADVKNAIELRFRTSGEPHERAKAVADAMGLTVEAYLYQCIAEGHKVLRSRYHPEAQDLEMPSYIRRGGLQ